MEEQDDWGQEDMKNLRRRAEQLDREGFSLQELANDLRMKRDKGEITEEEWNLWSDEIGKELIDMQHRTMPGRSHVC